MVRLTKSDGPFWIKWLMGAICCFANKISLFPGDFHGQPPMTSMHVEANLARWPRGHIKYCLLWHISTKCVDFIFIYLSYYHFAIYLNSKMHAIDHFTFSLLNGVLSLSAFWYPHFYCKILTSSVVFIAETLVPFCKKNNPSVHSETRINAMFSLLTC